MDKIYLSIVSLLLFSNFSLPAFAQFNPSRPSFFRDGYDLMQQQIQNLEDKPPEIQPDNPSQLLTIDSGNWQWQKIVFQEGGFSIWMPEATQSQEKVTLNTHDTPLDFLVFASHPKSSRFLAAYSNPVTPNQLANPQTLLDAIAQGIITKTQYNLISDRNIILDNQYQGKELILKSYQEMITFRLYLVQQRIYVLGASQNNSQNLSEQITAFFNSLKLLQ